MLRLLGLLPPLEPSAQEIAAARIQRQTGYTVETIAALEDTVRQRDEQLRALEERLTTQILRLQKERDEYLMGQEVGLSDDTPLPPATADDAARLAEEVARNDHYAGHEEQQYEPAAAQQYHQQQVHPDDQAHYFSQQQQLQQHDGDGRHGGTDGGLAEEQIHHYEGQIEQLHAHIAQLQAEIEARPSYPSAASSQQQSGPAGASSTGYSNPAAEATAATLRDMSARLTHATDEAAHWRSEFERVSSERDQLEKHLTGLLASPAISNANKTPMQFPSAAGAITPGPLPPEPNSNEDDEASALRAQLHLAQRAAEERRAALDAEQARAQQLSDYIQQMEQSQQQLQEQLHYAQQQLQQQSSSQHNSPARPTSDGARDDDAQSLSPAMQAAQDTNAQLQAELQRIHGLLRQAQEHATQGDAQIAHLQAELLRLSSAPAPTADASAPGGADVSALHAQIAQLQAQVDQQAAQSVEDKRRTQSILADKLEQVRTVILSKDAVIVKLKQQLAQIQGQAGLYNHEPDTPSPQRAQQQQQPHQHSPVQQQQHLPPPPLPPAHGYQPSHAQAPLSHYPPPQFASPSSAPHSAPMPTVHKQRV